MNNSFFAATFFLLLLVPFPVGAQNQNTAQTIDKYLAARTELGRFSGAVLVARGDEIILRKGYGFADVEKKLPFTPETKQMAASISKMFTAMSVLKLGEQGKLKLDDPICSYFENCPDAWKPVTIDNLIRHVSGIPDYEEKLDMGSEKYFEFMTGENTSARIVEDAKTLPLDFAPGEQFKYSNTGYIVLGFIVEKVSKLSLGRFVRKSLLKPAGMKSSGFIDIKHPPKDLAFGYTHGDIGWEKAVGGFPLTGGLLKKEPRLTLSSPAGDGGLYSTVDDLFRWSRVMDGKAPVSPGTVSRVFTPGKGAYGDGWFIYDEFNRRKYRHNGVLPGHVSEFIKFPDDHLTIIILSNLDRTRMSSVTRDITAIALGLPYDLPVRGTVVKLTDQQKAALEGEYKTADGKILTVRNEPDYLTGTMKDANGQLEFIAGWIPLSPTEFYFPFRDGKVIFTLDENGEWGTGEFEV
jgi:CubicO group peptidase (beta-lactamase class C family)